MTIRRAAERLREVGSIPVLAAALLLLAGTAFAGGDRSGAHHNSGGSGRSAVPSGGGGSHSSSSGHGSSSGGGDRASAPRTGVPIGSGGHSGANRQPSTHHDHGSHFGHGGGYYGGYYGGYHGGFYGGYGYPYYYPYGFWPRFWWGWYWDDYYREPYGYGYGGYGHRYGGDGYGSRDQMGAIDLDLSPGRTEVFLDGENIGTVDDFDGWPQYLWLPKGTYDIAFYLDGYKTLSRQVSIYPGLVIDMDDRMEAGQSTRPEELSPKTHERRDSRIDYERDRAERIDRGTWDHRKDDGDWRERAPRRERSDADRGIPPAPPQGDNRNDRDGRNAAPSGDAGWLRLNVDPDDASVYLDGRFAGTGGELASMQRGLKVGVGVHHLAIVRPGREPEERDFEVAAGEEIKLDIDLESND
jgi:hypothetical protein